MNLQSHFGYHIITKTLNIALRLKMGRNCGQTDRRTNDPITRCPQHSGRGHKMYTIQLNWAKPLRDSQNQNKISLEWEQEYFKNKKLLKTVCSDWKANHFKIRLNMKGMSYHLGINWNKKYYYHPTGQVEESYRETRLSSMKKYLILMKNINLW